MDAQFLLPLIGGLGIGSLLTTVTHWYFLNRNEQKKRSFEEKKEAYVGLIDALYQLEVEFSHSNSKKYGLWEIRAVLVGSPEVVMCAKLMKKTEPGSAERKKTLDDLLEEMRKDLGVDTRELGKS